jgi:RND family efflux transporter MFP subunit
MLPRLKALSRLILGTAFASAMVGCGPGGPGKSASRAGDSRTVQTVPVSEQRIDRSIVALGALIPNEHATLSAKVSGRLASIHVDLGSRVKKGDALAQIESRDYELKARQAEAILAQSRAELGVPPDSLTDQIDVDLVSSVMESRAVLDEARANLDRTVMLAKEKISSDAQMDSARSVFLVASNRYQVAVQSVQGRQAVMAQRRAELEIARQQLTDTTIVAPFDGGIQERRASLGEYLIVGAPVLTLVRLDPLRLRVEVSERDATRVRLGQTLRFSVEGQTNVYEGVVQRLSPALDEGSRMMTVEADIRNDGRLRAGGFIRAEIVTDPESKILSIPASAVVSFAGLDKAFVVKDGKAAEKRLNVGLRNTNWVEVVSGLAAGDAVILNPGSLVSGVLVSAGSGPAKTGRTN